MVDTPLLSVAWVVRGVIFVSVPLAAVGPVYPFMERRLVLVAFVFRHPVVAVETVVAFETPFVQVAAMPRTVLVQGQHGVYKVGGVHPSYPPMVPSLLFVPYFVPHDPGVRYGRQPLLEF